MTETSNEPERSDSDELADVETRRTFLTALAMNDAHALLTEVRGHSETEAIWLAFRAVALELVSTSIRAMELEEKATACELAGKVSGAMMAGLLGFETRNEENDNENPAFLRSFKDEVRATGTAIRLGAGLTGVGA
jgi:hypothetical protein